MLLNIFLIIIAIRPCALMPIAQNLDSFVIHSDNIGEIGAHHDNIAHSLEPNHYLQPYLSYFNSIPDTYDSHLQYDHSSSNPFQERETESSSYDYTLFLDGVPSLDSESHYSDLDSDHQALQEYLEYHRKLSTYSSPMTEKGILQITPSIMPFSNSGAGTQTSPVMDSYHSNTSPHGEIMYGNVNMPTSAPGGNVVPQIHSSNTSLRNGRFTNDDMCIGSPLTGRKRTQPKWEQNILSPSKKGNLRVVQDTHTDDEYSAPILHQHQNKKSHSLNSESSHNQIGKLDEGFFGIEFVPSILKMETEHHILHQLPDPKGYKSWKVGSMIYAYAHHGSLIIKKNPHDFDHMNELWKFGSLYLLKLQNERFPHLDLGSKPPLMWRLEHVLFPMLVHKADWTFDLFGKIQKRGALKNKSLVYQSVCAFFTKWLTKLMDEYPFNWNNILHSGAVYETLTKGYGGSPKDLSNITLHLEFGASREFWVSLSWELYERWLEDNDIELYSAIINPRTHQIPRVFKVPYGLDVRKSMILEEGPYVKEEFERYVG
ncbi:hypothetical protein DFH28DRAFT_878824 [Melampsora americana]|nr:hypothetical protein DFH28DRAFT_878824 [Melampsora americana]